MTQMSGLQPYTLPYVLNTTTDFLRFIKYDDSNKTFMGYVQLNEYLQMFTFELTVSSNIFSGYTPAIIPLVFNFAKCKPDIVVIPDVLDMTYNIKGGMKYKKMKRNKFTFAPLCPYQKSFTSTFTNGTALPDWIVFDTNR